MLSSICALAPKYYSFAVCNVAEPRIFRIRLDVASLYTLLVLFAIARYST
jgi:hypothetical protein